MTNDQHCRIGRIKLKGGAELIVLKRTMPIRTTIETMGGKVILENFENKPITLERALFMLEDARNMLWLAEATEPADDPEPAA